MNDTGFAVTISNIDIPEELLPFPIEDRLKIVMAGVFERNHFKCALSQAGYFSNFLLPFGATPMTTETVHGTRTEWIHPEEEHIYLVEFSEFNAHLPHLKLAGCLIRPKFRFGMDSMYRDNSKRDEISIGGRLSYHELEIMKEGNRKPAVKYEKADLESLKHYYEKISALTETDRAYRALVLYAESDTLPDRSSLLALSYFSILESLVTNGRSDGESITKQLMYKINLLLNRVGKIAYSSYFGEATYNTLWKKLYGLRSAIAHGNVYDFTGEYQMLRDFASVNGYLDEVTACIIRLAIDDPFLVNDLREC